jgi:hypothetical protein
MITQVMDAYIGLDTDQPTSLTANTPSHEGVFV